MSGNSIGHVISHSLGQGGLFLTPYDADKINPATKQCEKGTTAKLLRPIKLNGWYTVVLEIRGNEVVGTLDGQTITLSNPLIGSAKHSVMLAADGAWKDAAFKFEGHGTMDAPILIRPEKPGSATFTGESTVRFHGEHLIVHDLAFRDIRCTKNNIATSLLTAFRPMLAA